MSGRFEDKQIQLDKIKSKFPTPKMTKEEIIEKELYPQYIASFFTSLGDSREYRSKIEYVEYVWRFLKYIKEIKDIDLYDKQELRNITDEDINNYIEVISTKQNAQLPTSDKYKATTWTAINHFMDFLAVKRIIDTNPCNLVKRPKIHRNIRKKVTMNTEEINMVFNRILAGSGTAKARNRQAPWITRDWLIILIFTVTAIRLETLREIDVEDIDINEKILRFYGKGGEEHYRPLNQETINYINEWLVQREKLLKGVPCEALFISNQKQRMSRKAISQIVHKYTIDINKHITPHKFRSSIATIQYEKNGRDILKVQKLLIHKSLSTTTECYINTDNEYITEADAITFNNIQSLKREG